VLDGTLLNRDKKCDMTQRPGSEDKMTLRRATPSDWRQVGDVIGRAFAEDPVSRWTLGSAAGVRTTFTALARHV
jgi:hypothetical protein